MTLVANDKMHTSKWKSNEFRFWKIFICHNESEGFLRHKSMDNICDNICNFAIVIKYVKFRRSEISSKPLFLNDQWVILQSSQWKQLYSITI